MDFIVQNGINCAHPDGHMTMQGGEGVRITVPFICKNSYLEIAYLADSIKIPPGGSKIVKLWLRHEPKESEQIRLQALSSAPALVQIQPTTIFAGVDEMAILVKHPISCLAKFHKFCPFCPAIRVQHVNDR
jgi:hypothetical protein